MPEADLRRLLTDQGFTVANMSYRVTDDGKVFEYRMIIRTTNPSDTARLAAALRELKSVREFRISPTGD